MLLCWRCFISDQEAEFGAREGLDRSRSEELLLINNPLITGRFRAQLPWPCQRSWLSVEAAGDTLKVFGATEVSTVPCPHSCCPALQLLNELF